MIASLRGTVIDVGLNAAVVECAGVGYRVIATPRTLGVLRRGEEAFILTTLAVKEDSMTLDGFLDANDQEMFTVLQSVSGFGPKLAMTSLAVMNAQEIAVAIAAGEAKTLQRIPGIGKRVAERLIVELKDKVAQWQPTNAEADSTGIDDGVGRVVGQLSAAVSEQVVAALIGLGFGEKQATGAVDKVLAQQPDADSSGVLRGALAELGPKK